MHIYFSRSASPISAQIPTLAFIPSVQTAVKVRYGLRSLYNGPSSRVLKRSTHFLPAFSAQVQKPQTLSLPLFRRTDRCVHTVHAMDDTKFKTAHDLGFVRRHRAPPRPPTSYQLERDTLKIEQREQASVVTATLVCPDQQQIPLIVALSFLPNGVVRVVFQDAKPPRHERHVVKDVVVESCAPFLLEETDVCIGEKFTDISVEHKSVAVRMWYKPFRIELVQLQDEQVLLSMNGDSMLKIESFQTKQEAGLSPEENDDLGRWEETFNNFVDPKPRGPESIGLDVAFPFASSLHGIPERTAALDLPDTLSPSGQILSEPYRLYNLDVAFSELDKPFGLYGAIPLLIGRNGTQAAGLFWLNTSETYVDIRSANEGKLSHWYSESGQLEAYLLPGPTPQQVFRQYLSITGTPFMPQMFSLGYHQCRYSYMTQEDARSVNDGMDKHKIPYDVLWLDIDHTDEKRYFTWDSEAYPDPTELQGYIAQKGRRIVTIIDPHIKRDETYPVYQVGIEKNLFVSNPDNGKTFIGECWAGDSCYLDFTKEKTRTTWASLFSPQYYPHFTANLYVWNDMNEPSVFDGPEGTLAKHLLHGGVEHRHVHNVYGYDMTRSTYGGLLSAREGTDRPFVLTRSFFAGSQRYCSVWTGDNVSEWGHMRSSIRMSLSLSICGIAHCGADVGGFQGDPEAELASRWYQVGAFQPFFRGHSNKGTKRREPWMFGEPYTSLIRKAIKARYEWIPLWYSLFAQVALRNGGPPMRPVWWEFAETDTEDMWMVGESLLVAPVLKEGVQVHNVDLPSGVWYDLYGNGKEVKGKVEFECGLDRMFVFLRGGGIVPKMVGDRSNSLEGGKLTIVVGLDEEGGAKGEVYVDDGRSFEYEKGKYLCRSFKCHKEGGEIILSWETEGEFEGFGEVDVVLFGMKDMPIKVMQGDAERKVGGDGAAVRILDVQDETKGRLQIVL